jgi:hypothetical protein
MTGSRIRYRVPYETEGYWAEVYAGTYRNGDRLIVLRYLDGQLHYWDGAESLPMVQYESGWWVLDHDTAEFEPLLLLEEMGERWIFFREMIHAWDPDSAPEIPPGG